MLYHFIYGERTPADRDYVFKFMKGKPVLYGIFCYTGDRLELQGPFYKVRNLEIGQDAWYIGREWVPCYAI